MSNTYRSNGHQNKQTNNKRWNNKENYHKKSYNKENCGNNNASSTNSQWKNTNWGKKKYFNDKKDESDNQQNTLKEVKGKLDRFQGLSDIDNEEEKVTQTPVPAPTLKMTTKMFHPSSTMGGKLSTNAKVWNPSEVSNT